MKTKIKWKEKWKQKLLMQFKFECSVGNFECARKDLERSFVIGCFKSILFFEFAGRKHYRFLFYGFLSWVDETHGIDTAVKSGKKRLFAGWSKKAGGRKNEKYYSGDFFSCIYKK